MRALMVIPQAFYSTRGTPLSAYHRTRELVARGCEVDILTYPVGDDPPNLDARVFRSRGPHFASSIKSGPSKRKIWFDFLLFLNLIGKLIGRRYDFVYTHEEAAFMLGILKPIFRKPYIYDMHSSLPLQITDWNFSSSKSVIALFRWVERVSVKYAAAVVAISPAVESAAKSAHEGTPTVVLVNHFELSAPTHSDSRAYIRQEYRIPSDASVALYTGSFVALQALEMLVAAIPYVIAKVPDTVFLLVGGTRIEIEELGKLARDLNVDKSIVFVESRPQSEMAGFMEAADVLVSPRIQGINPPGKLFSYLASGKPIVATDCLVHNQLIDDTCSVLTIPEPQAYADGIVKALTDQILVKTLAAGAKKFLDRYCSADAREAAYAQILQHIEKQYTNAPLQP